MKKILVTTLVIGILLLSACGGTTTAPTPTPAQTPPPTPTPAPIPTDKPAPAPAPTLKKITLGDSPIVLDLAPLLPQNFEHVDAASEGMSNKDMGLGPEVSEVELFLSEEPYQMIYGCLTIVERRLERAAADAIFKDEQQIKKLLTENIVSGLTEVDVDASYVQTRIIYPDIADFAVQGEGQITTYGINVGFDILWFRSNKVYVYLYSAYLSPEKQPLSPIAREITHRISMFSQ